MHVQLKMNGRTVENLNVSVYSSVKILNLTNLWIQLNRETGINFDGISFDILKLE